MFGDIWPTFKMLDTSPLTRNLANKAIVSSVISTLLETIMDLRLKRQTSIVLIFVDKAIFHKVCILTSRTTHYMLLYTRKQSSKIVYFFLDCFC